MRLVLAGLVCCAAAAEPVILGQGDHRYRVVEDWAKPPAGLHLGYTHAVAIDRAGEILVFNDGPTPLVAFAPDGTVVRSGGTEFQPGAHGLTLAAEADGEALYLAIEAQHRVVKTRLDGTVVWSLGVPGEAKVYPNADAYRPTWIAPLPDGGFVVVDGYGAGYVHRYAADRTWLKTWGGAGDEPGKLRTPHGVFVDTRGDRPRLLIADRESHRIQAFSLDGEPLAVIAGPAQGEQALRRPCSFARDGADLVVADLCGRVTILDGVGAVRAQLGSEVEIWTRPGWPNLPRDTWRAGEFIAPHGVAVDAAGDIYVVEWTSVGRITKLVREH